MSGQQSFQKRVTIPLLVILGTVGGLALVGSFLWGLGGSSNSASEEPTTVVSEMPVASDSAAPLSSDSAMPSGSAEPSSSASTSASATPSAIPSGVTAVSVMNGTQTAGLAKTTADKLKANGWTIKEVGNWKGAGLAKSTIFYPVDLEADAKKLAKEVKADVLEADPSLPQDVLTYVVMK